jgi:hypothetical protein
MLATITDRMPNLRKLPGQVEKLTEELTRSQGKIAELQIKLAQSREADIQRAAEALNKGRSAPAAKEPEVRAELENASYEAEIIARRLQLAQSDLHAFISEHRSETLTISRRCTRSAPGG